MSNEELRNERLTPLSSLKDYKVAKGNPDVLGWRVVGANGDSLGVVKDLIVDMQAMKARYISVVADRKFFGTDNDQYMLVPIGAAAIDKSGKKVFLSSIDSRSIGRYPVYQGGPIPPDYEYAVRDTFQQSQRDIIPDTTKDYSAEFAEAVDRDNTTQTNINDDFYNNDTFNEDRFYTSDQEVYTERTYPTKVYDSTESTDDLYREDRTPTNVEDSIATIERLENLRERGSITDEEFILLKKRALNL
ncbi:PRC-barrel domain-containing protein [uncultured Pontibacter sp.]|uniref:PRC-barrel domain-containing protein n=1 Tax=uncultured Pontibacter sp. TaxID=453356 RepID=UPI00262BD62C|nr:PRC-barrel domain-containing protein [uncultured Pontibacter sp.]